MSSYKLVETDLTLISNYLQANMKQALIDVAADRSTVVGPLTPPKAYFTYEVAQAYQAPCIFIVPQSSDFRVYEKGSNIIDSLSHIYVNAVVEGEKEETVSYLAYRYQAAMHKLLAQKDLFSADNSVQIVIKVVRARFSALYTDAQKKGMASGVFRKEVLLELDVEHYEKL